MQKILHLPVIIDKFTNFFQIFTKKNLTHDIFHLLLYFPNVHKDTLQIKKVILHERINV